MYRFPGLSQAGFAMQNQYSSIQTSSYTCFLISVMVIINVCNIAIQTIMLFSHEHQTG